MDRNKLKKNLNNRNYLLGFIVVFILLLIVWGIKGTHAYYNNTSATIPLVNAKVGNFVNPLEGTIARTSDINIIYYMESQGKNGDYIITDAVPIQGFTLDTAKSNCTPRAATNLASYSGYSIAADGTVTLSVAESKPNQIVCRLFYKKNKTSDVTVYALVENEYGTIAANSKKYIYAKDIPTSGFSYQSYTCDETGTTISYNATDGIVTTTSKPNVCYVYFNKSGS